MFARRGNLGLSLFYLTVSLQPGNGLGFAIFFLNSHVLISSSHSHAQSSQNEICS